MLRQCLSLPVKIPNSHPSQSARRMGHPRGLVVSGRSKARPPAKVREVLLSAGTVNNRVGNEKARLLTPGLIQEF